MYVDCGTIPSDTLFLCNLSAQIFIFQHYNHLCAFIGICSVTFSSPNQLRLTSSIFSMSSDKWIFEFCLYHFIHISHRDWLKGNMTAIEIIIKRNISSVQFCIAAWHELRSHWSICWQVIYARPPTFAVSWKLHRRKCMLQNRRCVCALCTLRTLCNCACFSHHKLPI